MNKYIITILLVIASIFSYSQKVVNRANGANTVADSRLMANLNLYAPTYADTAEASTGANIGIDSCGAIIFTYDVNNFWVRKCNPKRWEELGSGSVSSEIDVFLIAGQSNAVGNSESPDSAIIPISGTAYQFYSNAITPAIEPIGNSDGSAWGAFASTYYKLTGRRICFVPAAVNGSSMASAAQIGFGTWDTTGTLYATSVTLVNSALSALSATVFTPLFKGVLWCQGEIDADGINRGLINQAAYSAAFAKLIKNYRVQFGKNISFNISRTGFRTDTIQTGYLQVQAAQSILANPDSLTNVAYWNAPFFIQRGLMQDNYHYLQSGYNEMGRIMAEEYVNSTSNNFQTQSGNLYFKKGNVGIGDIIPTSPLHVYRTGVAPAITITDSINNVVRIVYENKSDGNFAGAGGWYYNHLGLRSQVVHTGSSSIIGPDILAINSTPGITINSDVGDVNISTGLVPTNIVSKTKLRVKNDGGIGIGPLVDPVASALVQMVSTTRGLLVPSMTGTQQNAISSPANGLLIYNTDSLAHTYYNGTIWSKYGTGSGGGTTYTFPQSVAESGGAVTLVNDANTDSTYYGNLGGKGWFDASVVDISGGAPGMVPVYQGGQLFELETISVTPAGNTTNIQLNRNGAFAAAGSDSLTWIANGLNIKGRYMVDGASVIHQPDQSGSAFLNSIFYGSLPASLSHTTGITGQYNTGLGKLALNALSSGSSNTGLGARALQALNTGINNTAVGDGAGITITSGGANTAMGMAALPVNSTGNNNSAYGFESLRMSTASNNSAYGWRSSHENTSGADNAAFGVDAGYQNLTGSRNVYVGSGAGTGVASNSNSNNTGVGYRALFGITTGIGNIALGDSAGIGVTSGFRQIIIGNNVNTPSATASNIMTIGNAIYGTGMSGTGTTSEGRIGIGGSPANSKLEITSTATADSYALSIGGSAYTVGGMLLNPSTSPAAGANGFLLGSTGTIVEAGSGNHSILAGLLLFAPTITGGSATATNAATLSIVGAPSATVTGGNYAFFSQAGANRFDGTVQIGSTGAPIVSVLSATATLDFGSTAASSSSDLTITVTGAVDGDNVVVTPPNGSTAANSIYTAWVSAANTVTVRFSNLDIVSAADPASGTFRASVIRY